MTRNTRQFGVGIALILMLGLAAVFTMTHSYHVCTDCYTLRESYTVLGVSVRQSDHPTPMTDLLTRYGENPPHHHPFEMCSTASFWRVADGVGGIVVARIRARSTVPFLDRLYHYEDRATARRWKERLMSFDDSAYRLGDYIQELSNPDIPSDESGWRRWWKDNGPALERAVFATPATMP